MQLPALSVTIINSGENNVRFVEILFWNLAKIVYIAQSSTLDFDRLQRIQFNYFASWYFNVNNYS